MKTRDKQKLVIISIILFVMFNIPFLLLFNKKGGFAGYPIIYIYLFTVWAISIIASYFVFKKFDE